ncbi:c-type cytochrome [Pseudomonas stutzeri]|uniref:Cytochrome c4 n=1 Tax=Stutzerimonas stutzeri TaxID=316 RepID=A0A2N8SKJ0_STUST|nr:c-type cytochrome [Stutzerimonas stutzeri]MCQ4252060.1 c-type cytochrome [Stutzerimonas stutzeri]PNG03012.1 cytochrome c4 [Stutzerimonas stutzeri]
MSFLRWPLAGFVLAAPFLSQAADAISVYTKGGSNPAAMACVMCHGAQGEGMAAAGFPRLAGLSNKYLKKQLEDFASGERANPIMQPIATALTAEEADAVTTMLADQARPTPELVGRAAAAEGAGATLALRGAWDRNIPECVACHGPSGTGVGDAFPPLVGQSAQYLSSQLSAWRQGTRKNDPNNLMGHIARSLTEDEIKAVSAYFAGLTDTGAAK